MHKKLTNNMKSTQNCSKNIVGKGVTPVDSLPKSAKVPFQNRVLHYTRKMSAISDPV